MRPTGPLAWTLPFSASDDDMSRSSVTCRLAMPFSLFVANADSTTPVPGARRASSQWSRAITSSDSESDGPPTHDMPKAMQKRNKQRAKAPAMQTCMRPARSSSIDRSGESLASLDSSSGSQPPRADAPTPSLAADASPPGAGASVNVASNDASDLSDLANSPTVVTSRANVPLQLLSRQIIPLLGIFHFFSRNSLRVRKPC